MDGELHSLFVLKNNDSQIVKYHCPSYAFAYYKQYRINLQNGEYEKYSIYKFANSLEAIKFNSPFSLPRIFHFFYEWGLFLKGLYEYIADDELLVIEIQYEKASPYLIPEKDKTRDSLELSSLEKLPFKKYQQAFNNGYKHLLDGDCYQFNLTFNHLFHFEKQITEIDLITWLWSAKENIGAYAHLTYIPLWKRMWISNSPECLFNISKKKKGVLELTTMPIKGSRKIGSMKERDQLWKDLKSDRKEQSELFMIVDLLRNDLTQIGFSPAHVVAKKRRLEVPGLLHQYSLIKVSLKMNISLGRVMNCLFPGGSVTGAPKRRVIEILNELEDNSRGFYTGSTVVLHKSLIAASINIRSADVNFNKRTLSLGAGGGITLLSEAEKEFAEMMDKVKSFTKLLSNDKS